MKINPADIYGESDLYFMYRSEKFTAKLSEDGTITSNKGSYTSLRHWLNNEYPGPCVPSPMHAVRVIVNGSEYRLSRLALYEAELVQALNQLEIIKTTHGGDIVYEIALQRVKADLIEKYGVVS